MPIYEYVCTACNHELEAIQKMADAPLVFCPECSGETLKKKISAAAFQLKGSGWYETDFKNSGKKPDSTKTAAATKKSDKGSSTAASAKPPKTSGHTCGAGCSH